MQKILDSLHLNKKDAYIALFTIVALGISFAVFNSTSVEKARAWDIKWGYFSILGTFVLLLAGIVLNAKDFVRRVRGHLPCGRSLIVLGALLAFFSVFAVTHIQNTHRVLSDETSWESMALQMRYARTGGICNEGVWGGDRLDCITEVNNFKGKALGFVQSMTFYVAAPNRDTALKVNFPLYLLSLVAFFFALSIWFRNDWLALAATAFLGGMPIYLLHARSHARSDVEAFLPHRSAPRILCADAPGDRVRVHPVRHLLLALFPRRGLSSACVRAFRSRAELARHKYDGSLPRLRFPGR